MAVSSQSLTETVYLLASETWPRDSALSGDTSRQVPRMDSALQDATSYLPGCHPSPRPAVSRVLVMSGNGPHHFQTSLEGGGTVTREEPLPWERWLYIRWPLEEIPGATLWPWQNVNDQSAAFHQVQRALGLARGYTEEPEEKQTPFEKGPWGESRCHQLRKQAICPLKKQNHWWSVGP